MRSRRLMIADDLTGQQAYSRGIDSGGRLLWLAIWLKIQIAEST
jgi:hypothetical protein